VGWHTTLGKILIEEQLFLEDSRLIRPFCSSSRISNHSYSFLLQRKITDFGADITFGKVPAKLLEHYGIEVPKESCRLITESHATKIHSIARIKEKEKEEIKKEVKESKSSEYPDHGGVDQVIVESDGCLIPIVTFPDKGRKKDLRKYRKTDWKEARLSLAYEEGRCTPFFQANMDGVSTTGAQMYHCAIKVGLGENTKVHSVGDGATWIQNQVERQFGSNATYRIDFYHLTEYLGEATVSCSSSDPEKQKKWLTLQKQRMKKGCLSKVIEALTPYLEAKEVDNKKAPVRACKRYIENRPGQFDYQKAIENKLPIGSGRIESGHRYVIQDRMKPAGAWWKIENAKAMLDLRTTRENEEWEQYWKSSEAS